jgi:CHASE3 domain sensor protein
MSANASNFKLKFSRWGATLLVLVFGIQTYAVVSLSLELKRVNEVVLEQARCAALISQADLVNGLFNDAGAAVGGYSITKSKLFEARLSATAARLPVAVEELKKLTVGHPEAQEPIARIGELVKSGLLAMAEAKAAIDANRTDVAQFRARHMYKQIRQNADQVRDELNGLTQVQRRIESGGPDHQSELMKINTIGYVGLSSVLVFGIVLDAVKNSGATRQVE